MASEEEPEPTKREKITEPQTPAEQHVLLGQQVGSHGGTTTWSLLPTDKPAGDGERITDNAFVPSFA